MRQTIIALSLLFSSLGFSQVIIGDDTGTATDKTSVLLEFANEGDKGIILPYVRTVPSGPEGSIIYDTTDGKVKYYNGAWVDLSGRSPEATVVTAALAAQPIGVAESGKAIIGAETSSIDGVLVLESTTKAMVLPHVETTDDILNPSPGMMVYITGSSTTTDATYNHKRLAVFNGTTWAFWKP